MLRLSFLLVASAFTFSSQAQVIEEYTPTGLPQAEKVEDAFTELEYKLVEASGLLSLSQQIKDSAQGLIAKAIVGSQETLDVVGINHAQHFAIAKKLAKRWAEEPLKLRLLALVKAIPVETQMQIEKQLNHPLLVSAQDKERAAIKVQSSNAYSLYMDKLKQRPPAASRWALVENVDKQSGFSQIIIQARSVVIKEIKQQVKGWQPAVSWESEVRQDVLQFLFYAYRKTPNNELKKIADSFNQPELKQFYNSVIASIK
jgi:hypothetical protein